MILIEKCEDHYEIWNFASTKNNDKVLDFYTRGLEILKSFTYYFKDKANPLIKAYENDKIIRPQNLLAEPSQIEKKQPLLDFEKMKKEFYEELDIKRFYLGQEYGNRYLTYREAYCIYWCSQGKSLQEIAIILGISKRTVEDHVNSVKLKLNSFKQTDLVRKVMELGILKFFQMSDKT